MGKLALVITPGSEGIELEKAVSHPAGLSQVNGKTKSKIPYTSHEERMKLARMAMKRYLGSSKPESAADHQPSTVDTKGKVKGGKAPYDKYNRTASGSGSDASDNFGKMARVVKPSDLGSSKPESASAHMPPKVPKPKQ